jgi:uncharacterized protein YkwD
MTTRLLTVTAGLSLLCGCAPAFDVPLAPRSPARVNKANDGRPARSTNAETHVQLRCSEACVEFYEQRTPAGPLSMLQRKVLGRLSAAARKRHGTELKNDGAANALARDICRAKPVGAPPRALYEFALRSHGLIDPTPRILSWDIPHDRDALLDPRITQGLERALRNGQFRRVGIASCISPRIHGRRLLVALVKGAVRLEPLRRSLALGEHAALQASVSLPHGGLSLMLSTPPGKVQSVPFRRDGAALRATIHCRTQGTYQVEMLGAGPFGAQVLANFPIYCGVDPPEKVIVRAEQSRLASVPQIEATLVRMTNSFRRARGLAPLAPLSALAQMARGHSRDMRETGFVGHLSPSSGAPADRVRRAMIAFRALRENIAVAYRVEDVIPALADSPAHLANLQASDVTHLGLGVAIDQDSVPPVLYVTQKMIRPVPATPRRLTSAFTDLGQHCVRADATSNARAAAGWTCSGPGDYRITLAETKSALVARIVDQGGFSLELPPQGYDLRRERIEWRLDEGQAFAVIVPVYRYRASRTGAMQREEGSGVLQVFGLVGQRTLNGRISLSTQSRSEAEEAARKLADGLYHRQRRGR